MQGECWKNPKYMVGDARQGAAKGYCRLSCGTCLPMEGMPGMQHCPAMQHTVDLSYDGTYTCFSPGSGQSGRHSCLFTELHVLFMLRVGRLCVQTCQRKQLYKLRRPARRGWGT